MTPEEKIAAMVREHLADKMDGLLDMGRHTMTSVAAAPAASLDATKLMRDMDRFMREWRRTNVTVTVALGHDGPPLISEHPTDGTFIECSYRDAATVHQRVPLRLSRVLAWDRAEFVVAGPFGWVPKMLPAPPYEVPVDAG